MILRYNIIMTFYFWATVLIQLTMIAMILHVINYSGFTRLQKTWFILTFVSVMICSAAELAVHCGYYKSSWAVPLTLITVIQFSTSPLLAVFFSGALGFHDEAKRAVKFFALNAVVEAVLAPFGLVFYFNEEGYFRGKLFAVYEVFYFLGLLYLMFCMVRAGRKFRHRDTGTIAMVLVVLLAGIIPVTVYKVHIAYISIGISACLCYIYYNDLVQEDTLTDLISNQKQMSEMQGHTITGLANLIESRDTETGEHVARTREYVRMIAENAREKGIYTDEIDDRFISLLYTLAPMHDVGKIVVPDRILKKPGKLTPEEYEQMKTHASMGGAVVRKILSGITDEEYIKFASDIATCHHEKWDGSGYPKGLSGADIPLCARIMALADVYDALISVRCYKDAIPAGDALNIIRADAGSYFDPKLAEVFIECLRNDLVQ